VLKQRNKHSGTTQNEVVEGGGALLSQTKKKKRQDNYRASGITPLRQGTKRRAREGRPNGRARVTTTGIGKKEADARSSQGLGRKRDTGRDNSIEGGKDRNSPKPL